MLKAPSKKSSKPSSKTSSKGSPQIPINQPPEGSHFKRWVDTLITFLARFARYSWDLLGILLISVALIGLLALTGFTKGALITPIVFGLKRLLGWGNVFLFIAIAFLGFLCLLRRSSLKRSIRMSQILAFEAAAFCVIILLSILSGSSVVNAQAGLDYGGLIGWGLSELLALLVGPGLRLTITFIALVFFLIVASGLPQLFSRWIDKRIDSYVTIPEDFHIQTDPRTKPSIPLFEEDDGLQKKEKIAVKQMRDKRLPPMSLLLGEQINLPDEQKIKATGLLLEKSLAEFGVPAHVAGYRIGPTVTQFAVEPGYVEKPAQDGTIQSQKVRVSQISALARDLALALSAERLRIEAPVPGRSYVGIEVPNFHSTIVRLRPILEAEPFTRMNSHLAIALGQDVSGQPVVADLARMPHLLIAGTTGSGKSVCIAALTLCLVMNNHPNDLRVIMIDPKMVELVRFNGFPHVLGKVETDIQRILGVLQWTMGEMDHRYRLLEEIRAKDLDSYNRKMERRKQPTLPRIVLLIDELADLMMSAPEQTEHAIVRLAQMARATGIHLVVATQRPSTDVVTGLIKANFPARISFTVASAVDSRVILDTNGAETLLGKGDMLFLNPESGTPVRSQGVMVTDSEIEQILGYWQKAEPVVKDNPAPWEEMVLDSSDSEGSDALIQRAVTIVKSEHRASSSLLQRRLKIGYPRAARLIDELEELGIVGPSQGGGRERDVLVSSESEDSSDAELTDSE